MVFTEIQNYTSYIYSIANTMPASRLSSNPHLVEIPAKSGKNKAWACKYCHTYIGSNTTRISRHLNGCVDFAAYKRSKGLFKINHQPSTSSATPDTLISQYCNETTGGQNIQLMATELLSQAIYYGNLSFSTFESNPFFQILFKQLNIQLPSRTHLRTKALDQAYIMLKSRIDANILELQHINLSIDETTSITGTRLANIHITTPESVSLHYKSFDTADRPHRGEILAGEYIEHMKELVNGDMTKINSITSDTCNQAKKVQDEIQRRYPSILMLGCDPHGIQLVIKDIIELPSIRLVALEAQSVVSTFMKSPLQLAKLRRFQQQAYGKHMSLISSVITRWGSQISLLNSLIRSEQAFNNYIVENTAETKCSEILGNPNFWRSIKQLSQLFETISNHLKQAESSSASIAGVYPRWLQIQAHIQQFSNVETSFQEDIRTYLDSPNGWSRRKTKQLLPIHFAAYLLDPRSVEAAANTDSETAAEYFEIFIQNHLQDHSKLAVRRQFLRYRSKTDMFAPSKLSWIYWRDSNNYQDFWLASMTCGATELAEIALRILSIPPNSVGSERSFSALNLIHTARRNKLDTGRIDKLVYLYMNLRAMSKNKASETAQTELDLDQEEHCLSILEDREIDVGGERTSISIAELLN